MSASAFDIAAAGMAAHRAQMDRIAENIAGAGTMRPPGGAPFLTGSPAAGAADAFLFAAALDSAVGHDDADFAFADDTFAIAPRPLRPSLDGDADPIEQMVSLVATGRAYDADVAALQAAKQMDVEAIDVDRT